MFPAPKPKYVLPTHVCQTYFERHCQDNIGSIILFPAPKLKYFLFIHVCRTYFKTLWYTSKLCLCFYSVLNDINSLFYLTQMVAILGFIHNAMSKVLSYYITMSGIAEAHMLNTKIKNLRLFCRKYYHCIVSFCTNGGHFGFCHFSVS